MASRYILIAIALCGAGASAQNKPAPPVPDAKPADAPAPSSLELQRRSIIAMQTSIDLQRASVQKQASPLAPPPALPPLPYTLAMPLPPESQCDQLAEPAVTSLIAGASTVQQVQPELLRAVMEKESAFRPCAISPKGAMGLMQIMPETADHLDLMEPFDPKQNAEAGAKYLKELIGRFGGDVKLALAAYNAGPSKVNGDTVPDNPETRSYVEEILGVLGKTAPAK
jgi:soluble lytic murein transglycosylase-like protein